MRHIFFPVGLLRQVTAETVGDPGAVAGVTFHLVRTMGQSRSFAGAVPLFAGNCHQFGLTGLGVKVFRFRVNEIYELRYHPFQRIMKHRALNNFRAASRKSFLLSRRI